MENISIVSESNANVNFKYHNDLKSLPNDSNKIFLKWAMDYYD